jgi:two-component system NarL family response regulator
MTIRVMVVDDHRMFRNLLVAWFATEPDIKVVGEANSASETFSKLAMISPDVLILDVDMGEINGIDVARQVTKLYPSVSILALSGHAERVYVLGMLKAGARGYVVKSAGTEELVLAIREVANGHNFLSPEVTKFLLRHMQIDRDEVNPPSNVLGKREKDVLRQLADGKRSAEIAETLGIAVGTVETHRRNIKQKLGLYSTAELTRYAMREGLVTP